MTVDDALRTIGEDADSRARILSALQELEQRPENRFTTVRDDVTGPVVDALHAALPVVRKQLANGLVFEFPYRSKIARDFVMALPAAPDHVWEPQTTRLLVHLARTASDIIVGGAYFGDQAIVVAHELRGRGTCHAFEADAEQAAMLEKNAALNDLDNVHVSAIALWSDPHSRLQFRGQDALASPFPASSGIATTTIDAYVTEAGIPRVGLIMLDLEGGELQVLRGAERVLHHHAPPLVFEVHRAYVDWSNGLHNTDIVRWITSLGYTVLAVRDFQSNFDMGQRPVELVPVETAYLEGPPHGFNVLAVRDPQVLRSDFFRVVPNVSPKLLLHRDPKLHHPSGGL